MSLIGSTAGLPGTSSISLLLASTVRVEVGSARVVVEHDGANPDEILAAPREEEFQPKPE